ncbi:MAG: hypothetical protein WCV67_08535, partial [Victivallaceae bacterium]
PGDRVYKPCQRDGFIRFRNGSEIWFIGLDDKSRADKILGREFATVYFNEGGRRSGDQRLGAGSRPVGRRRRVVGDWEKWKSDISQNSQFSQNSQISKTVVQDRCPKCRSSYEK